VALILSQHLLFLRLNELNLELVLFICSKRPQQIHAARRDAKVTVCVYSQLYTLAARQALTRVILHVGGQHYYAVIATSQIQEQGVDAAAYIRGRFA
jgi:hypothetical protein